MATLIAVYNSDGCVGRCDARCYGAKSKSCHCICGGKNHGAGVHAAMKNVQNMVGLTDADKERFACDHSTNPANLVVIDRCRIPTASKARRAARARLLPDIPGPLL